MNWFRTSAVLLCTTTFCLPAFAQRKQQALQPLQQIPHMMRDDRGSQWDIQQDGSIGDGGNDLFDGAGRLTVSDQPFQSAMPQLDPSTNEVVFAPVPLGQLQVARRIGVNSKQAYVRYTEILENPTGAAIKTTIAIHFNMGGGQAMLTPIEDKRSKSAVGSVLTDGRNTVALIGAGRGSKLLPKYLPQMGSDNATCLWEVDVPARQTVAVTHLIIRRNNPGEAGKVLEDFNDKDVIKELSPDVAKKLANFPRNEKFIGDEEILRGELFDIVELRGGDQYKGTIKHEKFKLTSSYGVIDLPAERVIAMISAGQFKPRQLLVTVDGEIFGGKLEGDSIKLELSNGQETLVPLSQVQRIGYRKRADEPEEWKFEKPMLLLRGGDRMVIEPPTEPLAVVTRYGNISIKPEHLTAVLFVSEEHGVHEVSLADGSKLAGLISGDAIKVKLPTAGSKELSSFAVSDLRRLQLRLPPEEINAEAGTVSLGNGDVLIGAIGGVVKLQTRFDTLSINGDEIRSIQRGKTPADVQITLWDSATLSGQIESETVAAKLACGVELTLPLALLSSYEHPMPRPPAMVIERLKQIVNDLNADDWKVRERAEGQLTTIGPAVVGVLKEMRPAQSPEAQQRIDVILNALTAKAPAAAPAIRE